jgi:hypothetical protein
MDRDAMGFLVLRIHLVSLEYVLMDNALNVQIYTQEVIVMIKLAYTMVNANHKYVVKMVYASHANKVMGMCQ